MSKLFLLFVCLVVYLGHMASGYQGLRPLATTTKSLASFNKIRGGAALNAVTDAPPVVRDSASVIGR